MYRLKELRLRRNLTIRALAEKVGVSHTQITHIENGKRNLTTKNAKIFADFFGVSVDYLLGKSAEAMYSDFVSSLRRDLYTETVHADGAVTSELDSEVPEPIRTKLSILFLLDGISSPESLRMIYDLAKLRSAYDDFGGDQQ